MARPGFRPAARSGRAAAPRARRRGGSGRSPPGCPRRRPTGTSGWTNFRGWYEFGGGSIADMGHYSLWPLFQLLELESPISVESTPSHVCTVSDHICLRIKNDYPLPAACTIRMRFAPKGERAALDIIWYDGGIKPPVPE